MFKQLGLIVSFITAILLVLPMVVTAQIAPPPQQFIGPPLPGPQQYIGPPPQQFVSPPPQLAVPLPPSQRVFYPPQRIVVAPQNMPRMPIKVRPQFNFQFPLQPLYPMQPILPPQPIWNSPTAPVFLVVDAKLINQKVGLNFHDDQIFLTNTRPVVEVGVTAINPKYFKLRYSYTVRQSGGDSIIPLGALRIGSTNLATVNTQTATQTGGQQTVSQTTTTKLPVNIDWAIQDTHRIEASILGLSGPSHFSALPAFVGEWTKILVAGQSTSTTNTSGQATSDSEIFNSFKCGGGFELIYSYPTSRARILAAASSHYTLFDASFRWLVYPNLDINAGWLYRSFTDGSCSVRSSGPSAGLIWQF